MQLLRCVCKQEFLQCDMCKEFTESIRTSFLKTIHTDKAMCIKYINTRLQIADTLSKGSFIVQAFSTLCKLFQVGALSKSM